MATSITENDAEVVSREESNETSMSNAMQQMNAHGDKEPSANEHKTKQTSIDDAPLKILNGLPMMKTDEIFDHRFRIYERIGWDDRVGATYFGFDEKEKKEIVLRIDRNSNASSVVKMETVFLRKAEKEHRWVFFEQVHSQAIYQQFCYLAVYHRDGPSLADCINYMKDHRFSHGTAGRLAYDILNILEATHKLGYLLRSIHPLMFYLDVNNRHLFLFDRTTIQLDANQLQISATNRWVGGPHYAPLAYHRGASIKRRDEVEALFYLLIEMVTGSLPWGNARADQIEYIKEKSIEQGVLLVGLPYEYARLQEYILEDCERIDYQFIGKLLKEIYQQVGGIHDLDENFDFERDPTEEELPKFVLEKDTKIEDIKRKDDEVDFVSGTDNRVDTNNDSTHEKQPLVEQNTSTSAEQNMETTKPCGSHDHDQTLADKESVQPSGIRLQDIDEERNPEKEKRLMAGDEQSLKATLPRTQNAQPPSAETFEDDDYADI